MLLLPALGGSCTIAASARSSRSPAPTAQFPWNELLQHSLVGWPRSANPILLTTATIAHSWSSLSWTFVQCDVI